MIEIALYQPDIAQNAATTVRLAACLGLRVHIIEPAGFVWDSRDFRRAGMDYLGKADVVRQPDSSSFLAATAASEQYVELPPSNVTPDSNVWAPQPIRRLL